MLPPFLSTLSPLSIFSQQQIFIWWFTRGLCSPGCQQPTSFSAASRWFPGYTLPRFPPAGAAQTLSSVKAPRQRAPNSKSTQVHSVTAVARLFCSYLKNKCVVLVGHLQRHGGPHLHNGCERDAHFGLGRLETQAHIRQYLISESHAHDVTCWVLSFIASNWGH